MISDHNEKIRKKVSGPKKFIFLINSSSSNRVSSDTGINTRTGTKRGASDAFGEGDSSKKQKGSTNGNFLTLKHFQGIFKTQN